MCEHSKKKRLKISSFSDQEWLSNIYSVNLSVSVHDFNRLLPVSWNNVRDRTIDIFLK